MSKVPIPFLFEREVVLCTQYVAMLQAKDGDEKEISQMRLEILKPASKVVHDRIPKQREVSTESKDKKPWDIEGLYQCWGTEG